VATLLDRALLGRGPERGPAAAGVELRVGVEQLGTAPRAAVHARILGVGVLARERLLGRGLAEHGVGVGAEPVTPLVVGDVTGVGIGRHRMPPRRSDGPAYGPDAPSWSANGRRRYRTVHASGRRTDLQVGGGRRHAAPGPT